MNAKRSASQMMLPAAVGALAVLAVGTLSLRSIEAGRFSFEMAQHLAMMNVVAPLVAIVLAGRLPPALARRGAIWVAGGVQLAALWAWHMPAVQRTAAGLPALHLAITGGLALSAMAFWALVLSTSARWNAVLALLATGKLTCLLGAVLLLAPRDLYQLPGIVLAMCSIGPSTLADQQLAGLLMITACPLSYLVTATVLAGQILRDLERRPGPMQSHETVAPG